MVFTMSIFRMLREFLGQTGGTAHLALAEFPENFVISREQPKIQEREPIE